MMYNEDKRLKITKENLIEDKSISEKNKTTILKYLDHLTAKGISVGRVQKYCSYLARLAKILKKDFSKSNKEDVVRLLNEIERMNVRGGARSGKPISDWGKHDYRLVLKTFYKWLREQEGKKFGLREYPDEVNWFPISFPRNKRRKPRNLLKIEDIEKLVDAATNVRDKLFVRLIYETGARIGELLSLTLDGIEWDGHGATVQIFGKTGERKLRVIDSVPLLSAWLREHPDTKNKKALLFCGINGYNPSYDYFRLMLNKIGKKAEIKKPVNPHHFRHSRATELAKNLTEAQLCYYMGWQLGSYQPATYVHLSGRDLDSAILKIKGIEIEEKEKKEMKKPIKCPRCKTINDSLAKFCIDCGLGLDAKTMMEFEQITTDTMQQIITLVKDKEKALETLEILTKMLKKSE